MRRIPLLLMLSLSLAAAGGLSVKQEYNGSNGPIRAVSYTPDGLHLVVASGNTGYVLDARTFARTTTFPLSAYRPIITWKSNTVFQVAEYAAITTYDFQSGKKLATFRPDNQAFGKISVALNGLVAIEADKQISLYDQGSGIRQKSLDVTGDYLSDLDLSADGNLLVSTESGQAWLYDVNAATLIKLLDTGKNTPEHAAFGGDKVALITSYITDRRLDLFTASTGEKLNQFPVVAANQDFTFSPDNRYVVLPGYETIHVYDVDTGKAVLSFDSPTSTSYNFGFSPDMKTLVFGTTFGDLQVADLATNRVVRTLSGLPGDEVNCVLVSPDGKSVLSCGYDHTARLSSLTSGAVQAKLGSHLGSVESATYLNGGQLVTSSVNSLYFWKNGKLARQRYAYGGYPNKLAGQAAGPFYAYTSYGESRANVVIEDSRDGLVKAKTTVPGTSAQALRFSKDGSLLAILSETGKIFLWDWRKNKITATATAEQYSSDLVLSPSGRFFASTAPSGGVNVYDAKTLKLIRFIRHSSAASIQFSAQSDHIVVSSKGTVTVYDAATGTRLSSYASPYAGEFSVVPDGSGLVFASGPADKPVFASLLKTDDGIPAFK